MQRSEPATKVECQLISSLDYTNMADEKTKTKGKGWDDPQEEKKIRGADDASSVRHLGVN